MRTVFVPLVIGLFTHFIFLSRRGTYHFAQVFFFFFFSLLAVWDKLANPGKMLWQCNHGSMAAIHLGTGHITGWSVGDRIRQVAPPSQQANLDVVICQDNAISKKILLFSDSLGSITYRSTQNTICTSFIGPLLYSHL